MTHRPVKRLVRTVFNRFLLLPIGALIALIWANTAAESYFVFAHRLAFAVNEIGMAFFFALMAQEVAEAVMPGGALHTWRRWSMAIVAAAGGMVGAVVVYLGVVQLAYNYSMTPAWPAALAIDAAVTYYVLKTIMPRSGAVPFALLVALITDGIALVIAAPRYLTIETRAGGAALMLGALGLAAVMRLLKVRRFWPYLFMCGALSWLAFYWEGLHPAFALIPIIPFLPHEPRRVDVVFADPPDDDRVHHSEHAWHVMVQAVLFLFGLVNAGVILKDYDTGSWAMLAAELVGRPAGILLAVGVALVAGLHLPGRMGWRELLVAAFATSVGFAIALFLATGVLATGPVLSEAKLGVLGSVVGVLIAFAAAWLLKVGRLAHQH